MYYQYAPAAYVLENNKIPKNITRCVLSYAHVLSISQLRLDHDFSI